MAGIKIHASIDVLIQHNRIHHAGRGMWMDWMAQGTRITGNLCYDNSTGGPIRGGGSRAVPGGQQPLPLADQPVGHVRRRGLRAQPDDRPNHQPPRAAARHTLTIQRTRRPWPAWWTSRAATTASITISSLAMARRPLLRARHPAKVRRLAAGFGLWGI